MSPALLVLLSLAAPPPPRATPVPSPTPPPAIEGTVRTADGKPADKALVLAQPVFGSYAPDPATARTDATGRFRLTLKKPGPQRVRIAAPGWAPATLKDVRPGAPLSVTLQRGAAIEGTVRDGTTQGPVAGATVEARSDIVMYVPWDPDADVVRATTDERGRFRLEGLVTGLHSVAARVRGFDRASRSSVPTGTRVDLFLFPGAAVRGVVRDEQGQPLARAAVRAESEIRGFGPGPSSFATAGADGRFELTGLAGGSYRLVARHPERPPTWISGVVVERGAEVDVEIVISRGGVVSGRLVAAEDKPVAGRVLLQEADDRPVPRLLEDLLIADAGPDGRFRLTLPPGSHALGVLAPGYGPKRLDVDVGAKPVDLGDVLLDPGLVIRGRVRERSGLPVPDAVLLAQPARPTMMAMDWPLEARSEADGAFVIGGLTAGTYGVHVRVPGYGEKTQPFDAGTEKADFVLDRTGSISGIAVDDAGSAVPSFRVTARPVGEDRASGPSSRMEPSEGTDGRFVLPDVPEGTWVLEVTAPDRASGIVSDVRVASGSNADVGRVRLAAGGVVRGTVVDATGGPITGATVFPQRAGNEPFGRGREAVSDGGGAFELRGLAPGAVEVVATHPLHAQGRSPGLDVDPARGPIETRIVMSQGGRIEGRVARRDGTGITGRRPGVVGRSRRPPRPVAGIVHQHRRRWRLRARARAAGAHFGDAADRRGRDDGKPPDPRGRGTRGRDGDGGLRLARDPRRLAT